MTDPANTVLMGLDLPPPGQSQIGAVLDTSTRTLISVLDALNGTIRRRSYAPLPPVPGNDPPGRPVVEVSNQRQEVAFFDDRDASGALVRSVRLFSATTGAFQTKELLGEVALTEPLAAAYRADDNSYYVLDRQTREHARSIRLVRIGISYSPELLAEWRETGHFARYFITAGLDGLITISAASDESYAIVRIAPTLSAVRVRGIYVAPGALVVPAYASRASITYGLRGRDGTIDVQQLAVGKGRRNGQVGADEGDFDADEVHGVF